MKRIPLINGGFTIVDDEDFQKVSHLRWHKAGKRAPYARTCINSGHAYLHTMLMNPPAGFCVDHINGDPMDNRRCNLRICTLQQNTANGPAKGGTSKYKGVSWDKERGRWYASIRCNYKKHNLGTYDVEEDAARAYNAAAIRFFGEFARLNEV